MILFAPARFADIEAEICPLWTAHWREIGQDRDRVPLAPDVAKYRVLDADGALEITSAWRGSDLVGYLFSLVFRHLHYASTLFAQQDLATCGLTVAAVVRRSGWAKLMKSNCGLAA